MKKQHPPRRSAPARAASSPAPRLVRRRAIVLLSIFLVSFVPGVLWFQATQPAPAGDYEDYLNLGSGLLAHHQFGYPEPTARRLPGYPAFLAALLWVSRSYDWIALWNVALTASIGVLVCLLVRGLAPAHEKTAVAAGFITAANPAFIFFSPIFASVHLFAPLLLGSLVVLTMKRPGPAVRATLSGLLLGAAVLTRGEGAFYALVVFAFALLTGGELRQRLRCGAWLAGACLLVTVPWVVRNAVVMGENVGLSTYGGLNFYYAHNARQYGWHPVEETPLANLSEVARHHEGYRLGFQYLKEDPARVVSDAVRATRALYAPRDVEIVRSALWVPAHVSASGVAFRRQYPPGALGAVEAYFISLAALAVASVAFLRRRPRALWLVPAGIVATDWICHALVYWGKPRYRLTAEAFLAILAGVVVAEVCALVLRHMRRGPAGAHPRH